MAVTSKVLFRGAATTDTATTLYTTPSSTTTVATNIVVANTSSSSQTFTMSLDDVAIHGETLIEPNSSIYIDLKQVLVATDTIKGGASATSVTFHISGVEIV